MTKFPKTWIQLSITTTASEERQRDVSVSLFTTTSCVWCDETLSYSKWKSYSVDEQLYRWKRGCKYLYVYYYAFSFPFKFDKSTHHSFCIHPLAPPFHILPSSCLPSVFLPDVCNSLISRPGKKPFVGMIGYSSSSIAEIHQCLATISIQPYSLSKKSQTAYHLTIWTP